MKKFFNSIFKLSKIVIIPLLIDDRVFHLKLIFFDSDIFSCEVISSRFPASPFIYFRTFVYKNCIENSTPYYGVHFDFKYYPDELYRFSPVICCKCHSVDEWKRMILVSLQIYLDEGLIK